MFIGKDKSKLQKKKNIPPLLHRNTKHDDNIKLPTSHHKYAPPPNQPQGPRAKRKSKWKECVATCPFAGARGKALGCAFQRRKDARSRHQRLFVKNVEKTEGKWSKRKILSSGVVFTLEEAISTFNVYLKRQQPYFLELWTLCYLNFYFFIFLRSTKAALLLLHTLYRRGNQIYVVLF